MSDQLLQYSRAIFITAANVEIPIPSAIMVSGTNTNSGATLTTTTNLRNAGVKLGDIVYNTNVVNSPNIATVASFTTDFSVTLSASIFGAGNQPFNIYQSSSNAGDSWSAGLYIGGSGTLVAQLEGGETVTFTAVPIGIFPIKVKKVLSGTTASSIVALF